MKGRLDPMTPENLAAHARDLLNANRYLTLGTVDAHGAPWTTPVYFAAADERVYYWVSEIDAQHSRNLARRPQVSIVIFDSTVTPYHGRAVYGVGQAREVPADDLHRALQVYPGPSSRDATPVTPEEVTGISPYRLYQATTSKVWVLCPREPRQPCPLHGLARDHRVSID